MHQSWTWIWWTWRTPVYNLQIIIWTASQWNVIWTATTRMLKRAWIWVIIRRVNYLYEKVSNSWSLWVCSYVRRQFVHDNKRSTATTRPTDGTTIKLQVERIWRISISYWMWIYTWQHWYLVYGPWEVYQ